MPKLFTSYRRSETEMIAGRLRGSVARHVGDLAILRDKKSIALGRERREFDRRVVLSTLLRLD